VPFERGRGGERFSCAPAPSKESTFSPKKGKKVFRSAYFPIRGGVACSLGRGKLLFPRIETPERGKRERKVSHLAGEKGQAELLASRTVDRDMRGTQDEGVFSIFLWRRGGGGRKYVANDAEGEGKAGRAVSHFSRKKRERKVQALPSADQVRREKKRLPHSQKEERKFLKKRRSVPSRSAAVKKRGALLPRERKKKGKG